MLAQYRHVSISIGCSSRAETNVMARFPMERIHKRGRPRTLVYSLFSMSQSVDCLVESLLLNAGCAVQNLAEESSGYLVRSQRDSTLLTSPFELI